MSTLPGFNVFTARTTIRSADVNENFDLLKSRGGYWTTYTLAAAAFSISGQTQTGSLFSLDPGECITAYAVKHSENFTGGALSSVLFSLGPTADRKRFIEQFEVYSGATSTSYESTDTFVGSYTVTTAVEWLAESVGANLNALSTGLLEVYIQSSKAKG